MAESRVLRAARYYVGQGTSVVPIPPKEKGPRLPEWQKLRLTEVDLVKAFASGATNIGILNGEPSGGLTDVDLDAPEALVTADYFLEATERRHGRASKPKSHRWYVCDPLAATEQFRDADGAILCEIRSTGTQTLAPPSVHPSGESVEFDGDEYGEPSRVDGRHLRHQVAQSASAALIARHWPAEGARHECALALAGVLSRHTSWDNDGVANFIRAVCIAAKDPETSDRLDGVDTTRRRLLSGERATGIPRLSELLGRDVVDRVIGWLGIRLLSAIPTEISTKKSWPEPLDPCAFYGIAGEVVRLVEPHTEADPAALLLNFLIAAGSCIGRGPHAIAEADRHGLNLFGALVGESAKGRKGSSWGQIARLFDQVDQVWLTNRVVSGMSSGEGLIWAVRDPVEKRTKDADSGHEKIEITEQGISDKRLLVMEGELAATLKVMSRDGSTLSPLIRLAWDTGTLRSLTKNSPAHATRAHISIIGHITRDELLRYMTDTETGNGFANRFLWFCVRRSKVLPDGGGDFDVSAVTHRLRVAIQSARRVETMRRDTDSSAMWSEVYEELSEGKPGMFGAVTARSEAQVLRISALYAALDGSVAIQPPHLLAALAVWKYAASSARYIFGDALGDPSADRILDGLRVAPGGLSRTDVSRLFSRHATSSEIDRALGLLLSSGRVAHDIVQGDGRPIEMWTIR